MIDSVRTELVIEGMTCVACANRIQERLGNLNDVAGAQVSFATGKAIVFHRLSVGLNQLEAEVEKLGYRVVDIGCREESKKQIERLLFRRLVFAVILAVPVMVLSMMPVLQFRGWDWTVAVFASLVIVCSGWSFHRAAWVNLRHGLTTMDTLVSIGSLAALTWSAVVLIGRIEGGYIYFETGAIIVMLILLGKWLELKAKRRSGNAIRALGDLRITAARLVDGREISIDELQIGMRFLVRPGEKIATDGLVVDGVSFVDVSMITGEVLPVRVEPGEAVMGATINMDGSLVVEATRVGSYTALSQIVCLVDQAQNSRAEVQRLADRVSRVFVPITIAISLGTLVISLVTGQPANDAFTAAVAVLIVACPCALGLATPMGIVIGTGRGAELGIIIKGGEVLEDTRAIDVVVIDKTGTVTEGAMALTDVIAPLGDVDSDELLKLAASLEIRSEHPIGRAIAATVTSYKLVEHFRNVPGYGVVGIIDGVQVCVGSRQLFNEVPRSVEMVVAEQEANGATVVIAGRHSKAELVCVVKDQIKTSSVDAIRALRNQGIRVVLVTGDNERTAHAVGKAIGVDDVVAAALPDNKVDEVVRLQAAGHRVAMVGDGINDAPALAQADLGIAVGAGADITVEASDLTVLSGDLRAVSDAIELARRTLGTIKVNLFWAFAYNAAAIPLAAFGILNPVIAAGAMGLSSLFVVGNSFRLQRFTGDRSNDTVR